LILKVIHHRGKMKASTFLVILILIFNLELHVPQNVFGQEEADHYFTLERAVQRALSANLDLKSAQEETKAAIARKKSDKPNFSQHLT
jgi:hypothetical protein